MTLDRLAVFDGHDSILAGCWSSAGADPGRANITMKSGGCEATVRRQRAVWDPKTSRFVRTGKPAYRIVDKLCTCRPAR